MSLEFGWWRRDDAGLKWQIRARISGGNLSWSRKHGHHRAWEPYGPPTSADWDLLLAAAERRLPRRLISPAQLEEIRRLRSG